MKPVVVHALVGGTAYATAHTLCYTTLVVPSPVSVGDIMIEFCYGAMCGVGCMYWYRGIHRMSARMFKSLYSSGRAEIWPIGAIRGAARPGSRPGRPDFAPGHGQMGHGRIGEPGGGFGGPGSGAQYGNPPGMVSGSGAAVYPGLQGAAGTGMLAGRASASLPRHVLMFVPPPVPLSLSLAHWVFDQSLFFGGFVFGSALFALVVYTALDVDVTSVDQESPVVPTLQNFDELLGAEPHTAEEAIDQAARLGWLAYADSCLLKAAASSGWAVQALMSALNFAFVPAPLQGLFGVIQMAVVCQACAFPQREQLFALEFLAIGAEAVVDSEGQKSLREALVEESLQMAEENGLDLGETLGLPTTLREEGKENAMSDGFEQDGYPGDDDGDDDSRRKPGRL